MDDMQAIRNGPFAQALRESIGASGLSLHKISKLLAERGSTVSPAALSYWQNGTNRPGRRESVRAIGHLERILGLPDSTLVRLLGAPGRRDTRFVVSDSRALWQQPVVVDRLTRELGHDPRHNGRAFATLYKHTLVRVGAPGEISDTHVRHVVRAEVDRVDRYVAICHSNGAPARISAAAPCRAGRSCRDPRTGYAVAEVLLDRVLHRGDTAVLEYSWLTPADPADTYHRVCLSRASQAMVLELEFSPAVVPASCTAFYSPRRTTPEQSLGPLWIGGSGRAHLAMTDAAPGMYGIRWSPVIELTAASY
ncbi:hypothetical protein [Labedaea rhizosphaerae]|uniref:Helix-turn-helix protein n=1 Tax=Labedaea rhizosphaerae TaxID=598644 RepID=A0A4R6RUI2_LABRH|nr:hypothetical protein [Labedaea rhizosphaerae]TDP90611.1 hypothetical protein EV186_110152 [Labedaea rhizosphaerae]